MQETLEERLKNAFRNKILDIESEIRINYTEKSADYMIAKMEDFISHTIAETIKAGIDEVVEKRNGVIKEYKDDGIMFILKVEDGKTYEASMPIPKWAEVGKLNLRDDTIKALQDKK